MIIREFNIHNTIGIYINPLCCFLLLKAYIHLRRYIAVCSEGHMLGDMLTWGSLLRYQQLNFQ